MNYLNDIKNLIEKDIVSRNKWLELGISENHISETVEDNFWIAGETGPCGSDTEIFYFRSNDEIPEKFDPEDERWVEIWNDVFMQYYKHEDGSVTELPKKNVDTGMGLERLASVVQDVDSIFDVDTIRALRDKVCDFANVVYKTDENKDVSKDTTNTTSIFAVLFKWLTTFFNFIADLLKK